MPSNTVFRRAALCIAIPAFLLATQGCSTLSSQSNPSLSLIDPKGVDMRRYEADYGECVALANQTDSGKRAVAGAVAGALLGALIGNSYRPYGSGGWGSYGASVGAGAGAGGMFAEAEREKQTTLRLCLRNRGYAVIR